MEDGDEEERGAAEEQGESEDHGHDGEGNETVEIIEDVSPETGLDDGGPHHENSSRSRVPLLHLSGDPDDAADEIRLRLALVDLEVEGNEATALRQEHVALLRGGLDPREKRVSHLLRGTGPDRRAGGRPGRSHENGRVDEAGD